MKELFTIQCFINKYEIIKTTEMLILIKVQNQNIN